MKAQKWYRMKPHQYWWIKCLYAVWIGMLIVTILSMQFGILPIIEKWMIMVSIIAVVATLTIHHWVKARLKQSRLIEKYIRTNSLIQLEFSGSGKENITYYPEVYYRVDEAKNHFYLRFRVDGSPIGQRLRGLEQSLSDEFVTVCDESVEERGYITYAFERTMQKQKDIITQEDLNALAPIGTTEIKFSENISWNWKKTPHLLLTGVTGKGKTLTALYVISCLTRQGVRVIYCDPKADDEVRRYILHNPNVQYETEPHRIAQVVRETEREMIERQKLLDEIGMEETDYRPVMLIFDELIGFAMIAEKGIYQQTIKSLAAIVTMGRSKSVYAGLLLQRPDVKFLGEGVVRDNLGCRICMGVMSETAYSMAFGADAAKVKCLRHEVGSGLIFREGVDTKPREFLAPYIHNGVLFAPW